jgi:hypothetical protein
MKKYRVKVQSVEFEFSDGKGWSPESENLERRASAEFNDAYQNVSSKIVLAEDAESAKKIVLKEIERETSWTIYRAGTTVEEV